MRERNYQIQFMNEKEHKWLLPPIELENLDTHSRIEALRELSDHTWSYYRQYGRSFPWRETSDPYRVVLSELMLQQTQTERVLPKYQLFLDRWPDFPAMANSSLLEVLAAWSGLGYNRRALALRSIALKSKEFGWTLPDDYHQLLTFPMIGSATAAAIVAFCYHRKAIYLETNIRRVLIHQFFPDREQVSDVTLRHVLEELLVMQKDYKNWYYALMDYGAFLKKHVANPNKRSAQYSRQGRFENSNRQIRGMLLFVFTQQGPQCLEQLCNQLPFEKERIAECLFALCREGFLVKSGDRFCNADEEVSEKETWYGIPQDRSKS